MATKSGAGRPRKEPQKIVTTYAVCTRYEGSTRAVRLGPDFDSELRAKLAMAAAAQAFDKCLDPTFTEDTGKSIAGSLFVQTIKSAVTEQNRAQQLESRVKELTALWHAVPEKDRLRAFQSVQHDIAMGRFNNAPVEEIGDVLSENVVDHFIREGMPLDELRGKGLGKPLDVSRAEAIEAMSIRRALHRGWIEPQERERMIARLEQITAHEKMIEDLPVISTLPENLKIEDGEKGSVQAYPWGPRSDTQTIEKIVEIQKNLELARAERAARIAQGLEDPQVFEAPSEFLAGSLAKARAEAEERLRKLMESQNASEGPFEPLREPTLNDPKE